MKLNCYHVNERLPSRLSEQLSTFTRKVTLTPTSNIRVELRLSVGDGCPYVPTPAAHAVFIHPPLQCMLSLCTHPCSACCCLYVLTPAVHAAVFIHPPLQCELILCGTLHL